LPKEEKFRRVDQLIRSSSSIASNIAEGFGRFHYQENIQFCRQARGSLEETRDHIIAARDLTQAPVKECEKLLSLLIVTRKLLNGYIRYLKEKKAHNKTY
jgi:four helix bundle protein